VILTIVLLNVALTFAIPDGTVRWTFFLMRIPAFLGGTFCSCFAKCLISSTGHYIFLLAMVLRLPLRVRAFVLVL
jgi:hypothetical protein